jgi:hypothetical protein
MKSKEEIFNLYKKVTDGDKFSKKEFIDYYLLMFPNNKFLTINLNKDNLHTMYLHLYK